MRVVSATLVTLVLVSSPCLAVDPWYVTTDIPLYEPRYIDYGGNWAGQKEFWKTFSACASDVGIRLATPYRVPQFWDRTQITIHFELEWLWNDGHPSCAAWNDPANLLVEIRIARPSEHFINGGEVGEYPTSALLIDAAEPFQAVRETRYDPSFTYYYDPAGLDVAPGEMLRLEFRVRSNDGSALCQCVAPLGVRHLRVVAPVVLPFIFENGFEEGQAVFWSALYGGM